MIRTCISKFFGLLFLFSITVAFSEKIDTFYGPLEVEEPVLLELIHSPAFERLKSIHQYGVSYYTTHKEDYTRYDHSLGVFAVLKLKGASLQEQVAGLLHDVSHTVFSHVGDWIFNREYNPEDYQSLIFQDYLEQSGLKTILENHGLTLDQIDPKRNCALEQPLPNLCADRIDYNIQGAYFQGFITKEEGFAILQDLQFVNNAWVAKDTELLSKLVRFSLFMTQDCWGSPINYITSRWLADAILTGLETKLLSLDEIHFGTDDIVWNKLMSSNDSFIQQNMQKILNPLEHFVFVDPSDADIVVISKFRGIDPWILSQDKCIRLTSVDASVANEYQQTKEKISTGWGLKLTSSAN